MLALSRPVRTSNEVLALRVQAEQMLMEWAREPGYLNTRCQAVRDTCAWITGELGEAPASGGALLPDDDGLALERVRGEDLEDSARRTGGDSVRPGVVAQTLSWVLRDPDTERPL